ncbi:HdeD family acid-resistance protein [Streptomyces poonensis]|uniref:HdeD family acid-resistance protein n=1 Tax=Streptomyces poonensis TaxID=68255 RepID=A0A918PD50_9ACTN|nr:DUF308 domain-containing protein [Streptomyces poonensis]GGY99250.1 hypothetical protein GCM10010365_17430 [Streptomyces poonensis]
MTAPRRPASRSGPQGTSDGTAGDPAELLALLGDSWGWTLGSALVTLLPGIVILLWPHGTLHVLAVVVGLYLLLIGVFRFVAAFAGGARGERAARLLLAVVFVLAGVLCLRHPLQTVAALSLIVGVVWLVSGMLTAYAALTLGDLPHRGFALGTALLGIVAGIVVLVLPAESAVALTRLLGLWLILLGLVELVLAFVVRAALRKTVTGRVAGPSAVT